MHELAIVESLIGVAEAQARLRHARILSLRCTIGILRGLDTALLREVFAVARVGTRAESAELQIDAAKLHVCCGDCGYETLSSDCLFECPVCGSSDVELRGGDELELTSLDLELPDD